MSISLWPYHIFLEWRLAPTSGNNHFYNSHTHKFGVSSNRQLLKWLSPNFQITGLWWGCNYFWYVNSIPEKHKCILLNEYFCTVVK